MGGNALIFAAGFFSFPVVTFILGYMAFHKVWKKLW